MDIWVIIWVFLFISLFSTMGFGILNLFNIFCHKNAEAHYSVDIQRKVKHMYIMMPHSMKRMKLKPLLAGCCGQ